VGNDRVGGFGGYRPHVLVVSDDPDLAAFLAEGLVLNHLWASVVANPFQALEVFRVRPFDAVVVDAALGGFGWQELVERLRGRSGRAAERAPRADVPLFVAAASAGEADPARVRDAGADGVLVAPLEIADVAATLLAAVLAWRAAHPDRPWADQAALG
jgi:DNA-binding response OmpR family regulator